jgi:hypothetical protein
MNHDSILTFLKRDMWLMLQSKEERKQKETNARKEVTTTKNGSGSESGGGSGGGSGGSSMLFDLSSVIAAASKPKILEQRELDRMEVEYLGKTNRQANRGEK